MANIEPYYRSWPAPIMRIQRILKSRGKCRRKWMGGGDVRGSCKPLVAGLPSWRDTTKTDRFSPSCPRVDGHRLILARTNIGAISSAYCRTSPVARFGSSGIPSSCPTQTDCLAESAPTFSPLCGCFSVSVLHVGPAPSVHRCRHKMPQAS